MSALVIGRSPSQHLKAHSGNVGQAVWHTTLPSKILLPLSALAPGTWGTCLSMSDGLVQLHNLNTLLMQWSSKFNCQQLTFPIVQNHQHFDRIKVEQLINKNKKPLVDINKRNIIIINFNRLNVSFSSSVTLEIYCFMQCRCILSACSILRL